MLWQRLTCGMTCGGLRGGLYAGNDAGKDSDNNSLVEALPRERLEGRPGAATYWSENYSYISLFEADDDSSYGGDTFSDCSSCSTLSYGRKECGLLDFVVVLR